MVAGSVRIWAPPCNNVFWRSLGGLGFGAFKAYRTFVALGFRVRALELRVYRV